MGPDIIFTMDEALVTLLNCSAVRCGAARSEWDRGLGVLNRWAVQRNYEVTGCTALYCTALALSSKTVDVGCLHNRRAYGRIFGQKSMIALRKPGHKLLLLAMCSLVNVIAAVDVIVPFLGIAWSGSPARCGVLEEALESDACAESQMGFLNPSEGIAVRIPLL